MIGSRICQFNAVPEFPRVYWFLVPVHQNTLFRLGQITFKPSIFTAPNNRLTATPNRALFVTLLVLHMVNHTILCCHWLIGHKWAVILPKMRFLVCHMRSKGKSRQIVRRFRLKKYITYPTEKIFHYF